jgi:hypothetical protein
MITIGYGDISPINTTERIFVMVVSLVACGVFAYAVVKKKKNKYKNYRKKNL